MRDGFSSGLFALLFAQTKSKKLPITKPKTKTLNLRIKVKLNLHIKNIVGDASLKQQ
ncbi:MAG: hypothetical protein JHD28_00960 [Bacteroidia bacterium]|nr:hypothetical protein [Bacteroidia bacterium]